MGYNLGYSELRIINYFKENECATATKLYELSKRKRKPINSLVYKGFIKEIKQELKLSEQTSLEIAFARGEATMEIAENMIHTGIPVEKVNEILKMCNQKYYQ